MTGQEPSLAPLSDVGLYVGGLEGYTASSEMWKKNIDNSKNIHTLHRNL